jgi:hypothetical protein
MVGSQVRCSCADRLVLKCTDCTEAARAGQPVRPTGWGNACAPTELGQPCRRPGSPNPCRHEARPTPAATRLGQPVPPPGPANPWRHQARPTRGAAPTRPARAWRACGDQLCRGQVVAATARMGSSPVASAGPGRRPVYWGVHTGNHRATVRPAVKLKATPPMQPCN